eukprot:jgi/Bigna1/86812/estExt_fgenesh1_pg.C_140050
MSDGQGAAPEGESQGGCCNKCIEKLKNLDPSTLSYIMKIINIINAGLLAFTGVWVFISQSVDLLLVLAAMYVIVGTLAFGLGTPGLVIGIFTFVNAAWNVTIVCIHPKYFEQQREIGEKEMASALRTEAARFAAKQAGAPQAAGVIEEGLNQAHEMKQWEDEQKAATPASAPAAGGSDLPAGWEQRTDEHSGTPYWVNATTGEQSWEKPS